MTSPFAIPATLSPRARRILVDTLGDTLPQIVRMTESDAGATQKFLLALAGGTLVETVVMRHPARTTVCLGTQSGCAMGCVFCATGQMGFRRNLTAGEIVAQALLAKNVAGADAGTDAPPLRNAVFMGMGEPLDNYDAVMSAVDILHDPGIFALRAGRITLSTVGVVPGIRRLTAEARPVRLAVSLHAATQAERAAIVPAARKWQLDDLLDACRHHAQTRRQKIFFEWTLIRGKNDTPEHALALARLLHGISAQVNLIPLNPIGGANTDTASDLPTARNFQTVLKQNGVPATLRQSRGTAIAAGCGQLAAKA